jgi:hypothetical protein
VAQNYAAAHLKVLDERFHTESKTDIIVNKGIRLDFNGKKSVTIYNVDVVAETDYVRNGQNRFGSLIELGTGEQTFTLSQDKAFTFTVDQGNLEDSQFAQEVAKSVKRQVREVSVPTTDKYRLAVLSAYATANSQGVPATSLTNTTAYAAILAQQAALTDAEVPEDGRVCFLTATTHNLLKRDPEFVRDCDTSYKDLKKGIIGQVDGLTLVVCPASYYVAKFAFMIVHKSVLVAPHKFDMVRVLKDVQGIHGAVAEGRRYYDAFIPANKGVAIRQHLNA